jgi:molybdopterin/thiamine biosynthesis adenylyltransferase
VSLVFPAQQFEQMRQSLLASAPQESAALALAYFDIETKNFLVRKCLQIPEQQYQLRSPLEARIGAASFVPLLKEIRNDGLSLVFIHTHPFSDGTPRFSSIDDSGEINLRSFLDGRIGGRHLGMVLSRDSCSARELTQRELLAVRTVGADVRTYPEGERGIEIKSQHDRQLRAFGREGQYRLSRLKAAIVGLGGTGSVVVQELAYLGVNRFLLIDTDRVEVTNLNRLVGASDSDVGQYKTAVSARQIKIINPSSAIDRVDADVVLQSSLRRLLDCDIIFCCTDSHASRAVLNQVAYQFYVPCVDMGVVINAEHGHISHLQARTQLLAPGLPCLACMNLLDGDAVRRGLMAREELAADPYFIGESEPQPSVVTVNSTIASLATTMFLGMFTDAPLRARFQMYNALAGVVKPVEAAAVPDCVICSPNGYLGKGSAWDFPGRPG